MTPTASPVARRTVLGAALTAPLWPSAATAAGPRPVPPPSDTVALASGAVHTMPVRAGSVTPEALAKAQGFSDRFGGTSLLVWRGGELAYEAYAPGIDPGTRLKTYSMAKSVLGLTYGLALARGVVGLDDPIGRHVEEWRDDPRGAIPLRLFLQMRSGLKIDSLGDNDTRALELAYGHAVTATALTTPLKGEPGAVFEYANVNSFLGGLALDRALKRAGLGRYAAFLSRELWTPLGQAEARLAVETAPDGAPRFFAGLDACARDWLRLGLLFVQDGRLDGRRIVPAAWLRTMTAPSPNPAYGLQIWRGAPWNPVRRYAPAGGLTVRCDEPYLAPDMVFFDGFGGQRVYASKALKLVVVRTGAPSNDWEDSALPNTIIRGFV